MVGVELRWLVIISGICLCVCLIVVGLVLYGLYGV